jgi:hypothetical protein
MRPMPYTKIYKSGLPVGFLESATARYGSSQINVFFIVHKKRPLPRLLFPYKGLAILTL